MLKYSAHIGFLWAEIDDFYERFAAAMKAGFQGVEFSSPEKYDETRIAERLKSLDCELAVFNAPMGNIAAGEIGYLCVSGKEAEFERSVRESIARAQRLGAKQFMTAAGVVGKDMPRAKAEQLAIDNLRRVLPLLEKSNKRLLIEPVSHEIVPNFLAGSTSDGAALVEAIGSPHVRLELDLYHAGLMKEDIVDVWEKFGHLVTHIQIADVPGRHEPGTGALPVVPFLEAVARSNYAHHVGLEYHPQGSTADSLNWIPEAFRPRGMAH